MIKSQARRVLNRPRKSPLHAEPKAAALNWIKQNGAPEGGVIVHTKKIEIYPEVSGYTVPTLIDCDENTLAHSYIDSLLKLQDDAGFWGLYGKAYLFDTAQIVEGLVAWHLKSPSEELLESIRKALNWCAAQVAKDGLFNTTHHDSSVPEHIQLRSLRNLHYAAITISDSENKGVFRDIAQAYMNCMTESTLEVLSHFRAYIVDGISWFDAKRAEDYLHKLAKTQHSDGQISAHINSKWFCLPAIAQFGILFWQHRMKSHAELAHNFLTRMQRKSGGFTGGNGEYFPRVELSWAAKFFLDLANVIDNGQSLNSTFEPGGGE